MFHSNSIARVMLMVSAVAFGSGSASAATVEPVSLDDIVQIDALGFSCVNEQDLERAFAATGKKDGVVPQSCLPKPCDRLLDADQLAEFLGRDPTDEKWDEYVSRYAEYCVAETGGPWPDDVLFANASDTVTDFWDGLLLPGLNSGVGSDVVSDIVPGTDVLTQTFASNFTPAIFTTTARRPIFISPIEIARSRIRRTRPSDPEDTPLPAVPLPASLPLLIGAFGAIWATRKVADRGAAV